MFKVGDRILVTSDLDDVTRLKEHVVTKVSRDTVVCDNNNELIFYSAFCWPVDVKDELVEIINKRRELKKAYDDSMGMIYELKNKISRR